MASAVAGGVVLQRRNLGRFDGQLHGVDARITFEHLQDQLLLGIALGGLQRRRGTSRHAAGSGIVKLPHDADVTAQGTRLVLGVGRVLARSSSTGAASTLIHSPSSSAGGVLQFRVSRSLAAAPIVSRALAAAHGAEDFQEGAFRPAPPAAWPRPVSAAHASRSGMRTHAASSALAAGLRVLGVLGSDDPLDQDREVRSDPTVSPSAVERGRSGSARRRSSAALSSAGTASNAAPPDQFDQDLPRVALGLRPGGRPDPR